MYKELVERLRKMYTLCAWDELKDASDAIEKLLSENIQLKRRIVFWDKNTFGKLRAELDHLRHERDQAVEDLRQLADGQCLFCKHDEDETFNECGTDNCWQWRGIQEENNETD